MTAKGNPLQGANPARVQRSGKAESSGGTYPVQRYPFRQKSQTL